MNLDAVVESITEDEARAFLSEKGVPTKCTQCSHPHQGLAFRRKNLTPAFLSLDEVTPVLDGALVNFVVQVVCINCGYVRSFDKEVIAKWKAKKEGINVDGVEP